MPLQSIICLLQQSVNDGSHTAATRHGAGEMSPHMAPCSSPLPHHGKGSRTPKDLSCLWRMELRRRAKDWEQQMRPTESPRRGRYKQVMEGNGTSPGFSPHFSDSQKK